MDLQSLGRWAATRCPGTTLALEHQVHCFVSTLFMAVGTGAITTERAAEIIEQLGNDIERRTELVSMEGDINLVTDARRIDCV